MENKYSGGRNISTETPSNEILDKRLIALETQAANTQTEATALDDRIDNLENENAILDNRVDVAETTIISLDNRIDTIETDIAGIESTLTTIDPILRGNGLHLIAITFPVGNALSQADALTQFGGLFSNYANGDIPLPIRNDFNPATHTTINQFGPKLPTDPSVHLKFSQNVDGTTRMYLENTSTFTREVHIRVVANSSNVGMESNDILDSAGITFELKSTTATGNIQRYSTPSTSIIDASSVNSNTLITPYGGALTPRTLTNGVTENGTLNNGTQYYYRLLLLPTATADFRLGIQARNNVGGNDVYYLRALVIRVVVIN